ncbi:MAG: 30S ribosomal protein S12 methylthiotransferase RimO [Eubacterium sp.]|nr:30S ribosomal protein S12 methylthiotransferase RimO [Candidatus Colimonas fimequi]
MKLYIETMGCPKNFNDSEGIAGIWEKAGMTVTNDPLEADALMVNTCGFIQDAKVESIDKIFELSRLIEETADEVNRKMLIVCGCLTQRYGDDLFEEIPEIDLVMGVNDYERLPELVEGFKDGLRQKALSCTPVGFTEFSARKYEDNPYTATVRISEGCNNCCTYCVIPQIRGGYRSRPMESILAEAKDMAEHGTRELILIAQDVTEYGTDLYGELALPRLLRELCKIDGIQWIRLMYCYEDKITDELIEVMVSEPKICHYVDIPLQHVANNVLGNMNRRSTHDSIENTISRLRAAMPDIHIRTTFITGFPGETEEDFDELYDFAAETRFERLGVFAYSREEGTVAGDMENQIDDEIKAERADSIMRMQIEISREVNEAKVGSIQQVMVDGIDEEGAYIGRTQYDAPEIDNTVIFKSEADLKPGDLVEVRITDAFDYDLVGIME